MWATEALLIEINPVIRWRGCFNNSFVCFPFTTWPFHGSAVIPRIAPIAVGNTSLDVIIPLKYLFGLLTFVCNINCGGKQFHLPLWVWVWSMSFTLSVECLLLSLEQQSCWEALCCQGGFWFCQMKGEERDWMQEGHRKPASQAMPSSAQLWKVMGVLGSWE